MNLFFKYGGMDCLGVFKEFVGCNEILCFVNGWFFFWIEWSNCNVSCGGGLLY